RKHDGRIGLLTRKQEDLRQVHQSISLGVDVLGWLKEVHRLPCEFLRLLPTALNGKELRSNRSPQDLREDVVRRGLLLSNSGHLLGFLVATLSVEGFGEQ